VDPFAGEEDSRSGAFDILELPEAVVLSGWDWDV